MTRARPPYWIFFLVALLALGLLLFVNGCGKDKPAPEPDSVEAPAADTSITKNPSFRMAGAPKTSADTVILGVDTVNVPWADSTKKGDTLIVKRNIIRTTTTRLAISTSKVIEIRTDTILIKSGTDLGAFGSVAAVPTTSDFTVSNMPVLPSNIDSAITSAKSRGYSLILAMTGGPHSLSNPGCCLSVIEGKLRFDFTKWKAVMDQFATPAIKASIAKGVADGSVFGAMLMDEPETTGGGDGNTWGDFGWMNKFKVDSMAEYAKAIFPTLPVAVAHGPNGYFQWYPSQRYTKLDFVISQYNWWINRGDVASWRNKVQAQAALDKISITYSLNSSHGGVSDTDSLYDCGGYPKGARVPQCMMTPPQIRDWGNQLAPYTCGALMLWKYERGPFALPGYTQAIKDLRVRLNSTPRKLCARK